MKQLGFLDFDIRLQRIDNAGDPLVTRPTLYRLMKKGLFPQNFKIGPRCAAWDASEIEGWMDKQRSEKNEQ